MTMAWGRGEVKPGEALSTSPPGPPTDSQRPLNTAVFDVSRKDITKVLRGYGETGYRLVAVQQSAMGGTTVGQYDLFFTDAWSR